MVFGRNKKEKEKEEKEAKQEEEQAGQAAPEKEGEEIEKKEDAEEKKESNSESNAENSKEEAEADAKDGKKEETDEKVNVKELLEDKWILARLILQIAGSPKEHVEETLKKLVEDIKKYKEIKLIKSQLEEATEQEDKIWTAFAEVEIVTKNLPLLTAFCMEYMPSSVEILEPDVPLANANMTTNFLNDLLSKIHEFSMQLKNANAKIEILNKNASALMSNLIFYVTKDTERTIEDLEKHVGVKKEQLKPFIEKLVHAGKLKESEGKYSINKKK